MKKRVVVAVVLVFACGLAGGCIERNLAEKAAETKGLAGSQVKDAWKQETGEDVGEAKTVGRSAMSESHAVMASMILSGRGMDTDLSSYGDVYLVEFTDANGTERAAVYADGKVVLPANAGK